MRQPSNDGKPPSFSPALLASASGFFFYSHFLKPSVKKRFMREQSLYMCLMGKAWFGHDPLSSLSK